MQKIRFLILPAIILIIILPFLLKKNQLSTDIDILLPDDKWISAHLDYMRDSQIGSITAISIGCDESGKASIIPKSAEKFSNLIKDKPHIKELFFRIPPEMYIESPAFLCSRAPQILNSADLDELQHKLEPDQINLLLKDHYENLLRPGGLFQQKIVSSDPLNLYQIILRKIENTGRNSGFKFILKEDGLWSENGKHYLMLVYTDVPVTDAENGEKYLTMLEENLKKALSGTECFYTIISGHQHAIENRRLLQNDITITLSIAAIGFFLLFAIFFKDWRAVFVFIIPILGMLCAISLTWLFFSKPSVIILGLGATVIGIALDYGIHVFVSIKNPNAISKSIKKIARPLIFSALTTLGVFWAFFFSGTPGYHQLAFASTCGIAISLILSLVCLPLFLLPGEKEIRSKKQQNLILSFPSFPSFTSITAKRISYVWIILLLISIISIRFIHFDSDIRKMDASGEKLKAEQDKFRKIWGENSQAAVTVTKFDIEAAMEQQDEIAKFAKESGIEGFQSLSLIWPSFKTRRQNLKNWQNFWHDDKTDKFKSDIRKAGNKYGFSESAFVPFFKNIFKQNPDDNFTETKGFSLFSRKFIYNKNRKTTVNAFFPDNQENVEKLKKFISEKPGCEVISPKSFGSYISEKILNDAFHIAIIALLLVITLACFCLKKPAYILLALVPVISSLMIIIPVYVAFGWPINAIGLVAMIVVTGLSIDYGIFAVSAVKNSDPEFASNAFKALTISMLSTIIGSGALLWASHPALNTVGKVISIGVLAGYLSAVLAVPAMAGIKKLNNKS